MSQKAKYYSKCSGYGLVFVTGPTQFEQIHWECRFIAFINHVPIWCLIPAGSNA